MAGKTIDNSKIDIQNRQDATSEERVGKYLITN